MIRAEKPAATLQAVALAKGIVAVMLGPVLGHSPMRFQPRVDRVRCRAKMWRPTIMVHAKAADLLAGAAAAQAVRLGLAEESQEDRGHG